MMGKKFFTIIVVPHAKAKFRKVRVPYALITAAGVAAAVLLAGIVVLSLRLWRHERETAELERLQRQNLELRKENEQTRRITEDIRTRLAGFQETVGKFKVLFGVEQSSGMGEMAPGGEEEPSDLTAEKYNAFAYLSRLKADAESLDTEIKHLSAEIEERSVLWDSTPSIRPVRNGFISSTFGYRVDPFTGRRVFHSAIDISTWHWEEIYAPASGIVTRTGKNAGSGLFVEVSHGFGYTTLYAHLKKFNVAPGREVRRGDVLGFVGSTGRSTGPHLHYEVRYQGKPVNPAQFIIEDEAL